MGQADYATAPTRIGNGVFIGPNTVIQKGVTVGDRAVLGAMSFVNRDIAPGAKAFGCPARAR
jgi:acetyltransferase-like isoleucine patch superfamily enzyme